MEEFLCLQLVWGWYQQFMPFHLFSILQSNPVAYVRFVVLDSEIDPSVQSALDYLRANGYDRFDVILKRPLNLEMYIDHMYERWLLDRSYYTGFKYVWLGDLDFLHISESPSWLEQELAACEHDNFPYSNVVRQVDSGYSDCLTGWHFFKVDEYYSLMTPVIKEYIGNPVSMYREGLNRSMENERLLYYLVKRGIGVRESSDLTRKHTWRMTHGIHLGLYRVNAEMPAWCITDQIRAQESHIVFRELVRRMQHPEIQRVMRGLHYDCVRKPSTIKML